MGSIALAIVLAVVALVMGFIKIDPLFARIKKIVIPTLFVVSGVVGAFGAIAYNDAGYCQHIRTIFGNESSACKTGWYFEGWGTSTTWPHFITVAHTNDDTGENTSTVFQGSISPPYAVRLSDNWNGQVAQTTRFGIPQDSEQFIKMAQDFRSPERLISTTLRPAVTASLDSTANLYSMEEYYAGGQRDAFKTDFRDAVIKGRARVRQVQQYGDYDVRGANSAAANDLETTDDGDSVGTTAIRRVVMTKVLDIDGNPIREEHGFMAYGVTVTSAILENLDPDDLFEEQIQARKDAASRRIVAQEERREQEEQRLLAIQRGQTQIATRQAEAEVEQIEKTTDAETDRQLAVIQATQLKEEAAIARDTSAIDLERARIEAETQTTLADAEAYERSVIIEADNALQQKLDAWVEIQHAWADAAANINVPSTVFSMGGGEGGTTGNFSSVEAFMAILTANAAQSIDLDPAISTDE